MGDVELIILKGDSVLRVPFMAGNMKMFKDSSEAAALAEGLKKELADVKGREIALCPGFTSIGKLVGVLDGSNIMVGAQNLHWEKEGAYTGEVSAKMIKEAGCKIVIIGHSERRQYFHETDETVNKKISAALLEKLTPIVCVGETLKEREENKIFEVVGRQTKKGLENINCVTGGEFVIAYEPVWAIGTGKTATPEQAQEVHAFIRGTLGEIYGKETAQKVRILYGGSVKPDNVSELMEKEDIDGGLVGGACLKVDSFIKIVKYA